MAYYFVSDVHAAPRPGGGLTESGERFLAWLGTVGAEGGDAEGIFLLGDIFDFWFEYKNVFPRGFESLLAKFSELTRRGIPIHFLPGNHDRWTEGHLARAGGLTVHTSAYTTTLYGKNIYLEHGDRQSTGSFGKRLTQRLFRSPLARRLVRALVPHRWLMRLGSRWSHTHRVRHPRPHTFRAENEGIVRFARRYGQTRPVDLFVFGHLHSPAACPLSDRTALYVLGGWIADRQPAYGRLDADGFSLV